MRKLLLTVALAVIVTTPAFAGIQYEFMQKNTSDDPVTPTKDLTARATVEGDATKIEFISGSIYPHGTYVLTTDGFRRLYFVDPAKQWYTEVNAAGIASAIGVAGITISNFKTDSETLPDRPVIAGVETEHHRVTMTYDVTVQMKSMALKQSVQTDIDVWSTDKFGALRNDFLSSGLRTGDADVDRILDAEVARVKGFPMRQMVTTRTTYERPARSVLNSPTTRTMTRETWVTKIGQVQVPPSVFTLPATFRRSDQPEVPKAATQVLSFDDPAGE